jgi:uncharacterized membrane protein YphA (DoxX/SURF4 family)
LHYVQGEIDTVASNGWLAYLSPVRRCLHTHDEREAHGVKLQRISGLAWAVFFARAVLGLIFLMAGIYKVFQQGPVGHVKQWFLPYSNTFLPIWSLWLVGLTIPFVELLGGLLVLVGWRTRLALVALGAVLVTVTFGHLLKDPLYAFHEHVIPRLALLVFVLAVSPATDSLSVDGFLRSRHAA